MNSNDRYLSFVNSPLGAKVASTLGLAAPLHLDRYKEGQDFVTGPVILGAGTNAEVLVDIAEILNDATQSIFIPKQSENFDSLTKAAHETNLEWNAYAPVGRNDKQKFKSVVFDATGIKNASELKSVYNFFQPVIRKMQKCGRIIIIGRTPELCKDVKQRTAQRALEGFTRSLGKEVKKGNTANIVYLAPGAVKNLDSTLRFLMSTKSTYVSGQVIRITANAADKSINWDKPLEGKVALVTGSARGIGKSMAEVLSRDGAHVICLDIPPAESDLQKVSSKIGGSYITCDITAPDAGERIAEHVKEIADGQKLDIVVHNAGVTRDKKLGNMKEQLWDMVMNINLLAEERIDEYLLANDMIPQGGRIICVSSISGIAGNLGQTNYAMSKSGVIGMVQGLAEQLNDAGITVNAVAPGFIETAMTAAIPLMIREPGRRLNSMNQGGLPIDVAETVSWFASPASQAVSGNIVRVCGQSLIGA